MNAEKTVAIIVAMLIAIALGPADRAFAAPMEFQIPAGPASTTLSQFAEQAHINILFTSDDVGEKRTHAVSGHLEPMDALGLMLTGSGLVYQFEGPNDVVVHTRGRELPSSDGSCERIDLELCRSAPSAGETLASIVTIKGMAIDEPFDPGHVQVVAPNITLTRQNFEAGGFRTVGDVLRGLPQNFGGGLNVGVVFAGGSQNATSQSAASTVNLRGLGSDSTLALVNGQRLASSEGSGAVDITLIPISAVERIDITSGSASAQYGSDAVAGVVNIVIRSNIQGTEVGSALGAATEGGGGLQHYSVVIGDAVRGADLFAVADCARQQEIDSQQRAHIPVDTSGTTLLPGMRRCSEVFTATLPLPDKMEGGVFGAFTKRSAHQAEKVSLGLSNGSASSQANVDQYAVNADLKQHFLKSWTATLSTGFSVDDLSTNEVLVQDGAPDQYETDQLDNRLWTAQIIVSGTVVKTHAGTMQLSLGAGYNRQDFTFANLVGGAFSVARRRGARFGFIETAIPIVPSAGSIDRAALSVNAAVRTERYSGVGGATNSKIALIYKPASGVKVQASFGTSFRAPTLFQQFDTQQAVLEFVPDALRADGQSLALLRFGGNASLKSEVAKDTALDLAFTPETLPAASLQIGYFNILYRQRIESPTLNVTNPLADPNIYPFVSRNPTSTAIAQILSGSQLVDLNASRFTAANAELLIDYWDQNVVRQRASGVDLLWRYERKTMFGTWNTALNTAYLDLRQQTSNERSFAPLSGTMFYPPVWRSRLAIDWTFGRYLSSLFMNHTGGSREAGPLGEQPEPPQDLASSTTLDGQIGVTFDGRDYCGKAKLTLSAQNFLDRHPPLYRVSQASPAGVNYDSTNASPVGRFLTLQLTQIW